LGLFEDTKISGQVMAIKFQALSNRYGVHKKEYTKRSLSYVKDEGANLGAMTLT
jgi:hypothetical protein